MAILAAHGTSVPRVVVFIDPQTECTFSKCLFVSVQTSANTNRILATMEYESRTVRYSGSP